MKTLEVLAASMVDRKTVKSKLKEFEIEANRIQGDNWNDIGALILEARADEIGDSNPELREEILRAALVRAMTHQSQATSGSEGLARGVDVKRLRMKIFGDE